MADPRKRSRTFLPKKSVSKNRRHPGQRLVPEDLFWPDFSRSPQWIVDLYQRRALRPRPGSEPRSRAHRFRRKDRGPARRLQDYPDWKKSLLLHDPLSVERRAWEHLTGFRRLSQRSLSWRRG